MSGHSKWATIKRKKAATDAKRSRAFTKVLKEIGIAVAQGGPDPDSNPSLRMAISNGKGVNLPKENIERAIKKASDKDAAALNEVTYEGYAPDGVAIFLECTTDNINRTVSNVRSIFTRLGGTLGTNGSLEFMFDRKGVFTLPVNDLDEDDFTLEVIDAGAEDVAREGDVF
ncbi:MAG TPA: YebC/PmpR family DNA-binding transcriptional regulator, partial [Flavobacteriales bacterium]|nr:YebC/PmpR family DNA-binding transcriptional regulator [Flavobacteriales bacterium]